MPLTNADFQKFLGNKKDKADAEPAKPNLDTQIKKQERKKRYLALQKRFDKKAKKDGAAPTKDGVDTTVQGYLDRAAQRRKGEGEYQQVAEEFEQSRERSIEESKFLGGDSEHTHLVKGLDYSLLAKVRSEIEQQSSLPSVTDAPSANEVVVSGFRTAIGRRVLEVICGDLHPHHFSFQKSMRKIEQAVEAGARFRGNSDAFHPGRMIFSYQRTSDGPNLPTILMQSKDNIKSAEVKHVQRKGTIVSVLNQSLAEEISNVVKWHQANKRLPREERKTAKDREKEQEREKTQPAPQHSSEPNGVEVPVVAKPEREEIEEDDIFGGVGGFDATETTRDVQPDGVDE